MTLMRRTAIRSFGLACGLVTSLACAGVDGAPPPERAPASVPAPAAPAPVAPADSPADVIRSLYATYADDTARDPRWLPFASERLARTWRAAVEESRDACGVPAIFESDPVVDAQDFGPIQDLQVEAQRDGKNAATATARFVNLGQPATVGFDLVRDGGAWRIDNIRPSRTGLDLNGRIRDTVVAGDGC
jgi:hypothetical protein